MVFIVKATFIFKQDLFNKIIIAIYLFITQFKLMTLFSFMFSILSNKSKLNKICLLIVFLNFYIFPEMLANQK